jgi:predicted amidophosphoribosyltransferase
VSSPAQCVVCDSAIDPYGQNVRCDRCAEPCHICGGNVARCGHPLAEPLTEVRGDPFRRAAA